MRLDSLQKYTTDELLSELMSRNQVLLHRVRATLNGEGIDKLILDHESTLIVEDAPDAKILMEVMVNGSWWGRNWNPVQGFVGIHSGEYD